MPRLDVPVGLGDPFERVAPVDDRPDLPRLEQFPEEDQVPGIFRRRTVRGEKASVPLEQVPALRPRRFADRVEDDVEGRPVPVKSSVV